jgi:hypothetical protein
VNSAAWKTIKISYAFSPLRRIMRKLKFLFAAGAAVVGLLTFLSMLEIRIYLADPHILLEKQRLVYVLLTVGMVVIIYLLCFLCLKVLGVQRTTSAVNNKSLRDNILMIKQLISGRGSCGTGCQSQPGENAEAGNAGIEPRKYFVSLHPDLSYHKGIYDVLHIIEGLKSKSIITRTHEEINEAYISITKKIKDGDVLKAMSYEQGAAFAVDWLTGESQELLQKDAMGLIFDEKTTAHAFAVDYHLTKFPSKSCEQGIIDAFDVIFVHHTYIECVSRLVTPGYLEVKRVSEWAAAGNAAHSEFAFSPYESGVADAVSWLLGVTPAPDSDN